MWKFITYHFNENNISKNIQTFQTQQCVYFKKPQKIKITYNLAPQR